MRYLVLILLVTFIAINGNTKEAESVRPVPILEFLKAEREVLAKFEFKRYYLNIKNHEKYSKELFRVAPDLPPCGLNKNSSRTWVNIYNQDNNRIYGWCGFDDPSDLTKVSFAVRKGVVPPKKVYVELWDREKDIKYKSNLVTVY